MRCHHRLPLTVLLLVLLAVGGCGHEEARRRAAAQAATVAALTREKHALDGLRADVAPLRTRVQHAPVGADGAPLYAEDATLARDVDARERVIAQRSAALEAALVRLVGSFVVRAGEPTPAVLQAAIRLKSGEDLAVAREWIERGGDYRRAIAIYEAQLHADPGYSPLRAALAAATAGQFVDPDRVASVEPGMTRAEVRDLLGPVNLRNVVQRPTEHVEAWFYPRAKGGTAAIYFRYDAGRHAFLVYRAEAAAGSTTPPPPATRS
jgi:hypothetical protein